MCIRSSQFWRQSQRKLFVHPRVFLYYNSLCLEPERSESRGKAHENHADSAVARRSRTRTRARSCRSAPSTRTSCAWCRATRTSTRRVTSCSCTSTGRASPHSCSTRRPKPGLITRPTRATRTYVLTLMYKYVPRASLRLLPTPTHSRPSPPLTHVLCAQPLLCSTFVYSTTYSNVRIHSVLRYSSN